MATDKNTTIRLLYNVPLDNTYTNTIYFASESAQTSYFNGKKQHEFKQQSYQRLERGTCKVDIKSDAIIDCNYMMYRNISHSDKWYYAFVTSVEYVNDHTSEVFFEIDVMQTFMFDYSLKRCFVEREHVMTDSKFSHFVPEPFPLGETVVGKCSSLFTADEYEQCWIVGSTVNISEGKKAKCRYTNGNIVGFYLYAGESDPTDIIANIQKITDEGVLFAQTIPKILYSGLSVVSKLINSKAFSTQRTKTKSFTHDKINGYVPRNNKCFNYPYYGLFLSNQQGGQTVIPFANLSNKTKISFRLWGEINPNGTLILSLQDNKPGGYESHDYDLNLGTNPQGSFASDASNAFETAQMNARIDGTLSAISSMGVGGGSSLGGSVVKAGADLISGLANTEMTLARMEAQYANIPSNVHNLAGCSILGARMGLQNPKVGIRMMRNDLVKSLDDFLDMYGYQVNKVKVPNISGRKAWNYVKCGTCNIAGHVPSKYSKQIVNNYINGITFWKNPAKVGDYSQNNKL